MHLFCVQAIHIHHTLFELCVMGNKKKKEFFTMTSQGWGNRSGQSGPMFTLFHRHFSNNLPDSVVGVAESLAANYRAVNAYALMSIVESHSQTN